MVAYSWRRKIPRGIPALRQATPDLAGRSGSGDAAPHARGGLLATARDGG